MSATARVLVLSIDATLADLMKLNLERRDFGVRQQTWAACCGAGAAISEEADLVIADLDCPPPACWNGLNRLRVLFPSHPLLLLAHDWPHRPFLDACYPCRYLQKPFAIDEFMQAVGSLISAGPELGIGRRVDSGATEGVCPNTGKLAE